MSGDSVDDREVLALLAEGRANPQLIREETGLEKGKVNTILVRLARQGYIRQVTRGLYELTVAGQEEVGGGSEGSLQRLVDELEAACERGDAQQVQQVVDELRDYTEG